MIRLNGELIDIPPAVRCFQRFTSEQRADMMASHRLGRLQKQRVGEVYWTHPLVPNLAFPSKKAALRAALATVANVETAR